MGWRNGSIGPSGGPLYPEDEDTSEKKQERSVGLHRMVSTQHGQIKDKPGQ